MTARLLLVDDDEALGDMLKEGLERRGYEVTLARDGTEALRSLERLDFDVVLTDLTMPKLTGMQLCERIVASRPDVPVVVMTAFGNMEVAISAIRAGAYDFVNKPLDIDDLSFTLKRACDHRALREELVRLRRATGAPPPIEGLVGDSPAIQRMVDVVDRVADSEATILIAGETGTGKELVARAIHHGSRRSAGPFVAVNCAALPESLLESMLFGHVRGAFTDAREDRPGFFAEANKGTLLLDEVGDLPLAFQPKLLRALQERCTRPLGASHDVPVDVRIIAATNRDLESAVEERRFREDLFYRLNVVQIDVPPLRARGGDVLLLAQHFLSKTAARSGKCIRGFTPSAARKLIGYNWPGNVRELQNCVERAVALARFDQVGADDLPDRISGYSGSHVLVVGDDPSELPPMEEVERRYILRVLEAAGGNRSTAARVLGLDRKTLYRKLLRFGYGGDDPTG